LPKSHPVIHREVSLLRRLPLSIYALIICLLAGIGCKASADNRMIMTGDDPYNLRVLAFQCYIEGQTESALETYQRAVKRAIEEYGDDSTIVADIYYEMGSLAFDAGKENTAESWLNESLKRNPNSEMARIKLAEIYRVRSKHDQALAQIQTCLKRNRNSITARRALVVWLQEKGFVALATQESYVLNQISAGNKDHRIAPSASTQVATAIKNPPEASIKKEEVAPTKAAEPKPEAKPAQKVKAPPSIVAALMKRVETAAKKKEQPAVKPVAKQPVVKQPVVVKQPKKLVKPESKKEENKKEAPKKEEPKQEVAKTPPAKKIEKPPAPRMEPPVVATTQPKRSKNGLVPPPPPIMPPFGMFPPPPPMGFNNGPLLQTHAALKKEKPKAEPKESPKEAKETAKDTKDTASVDEEGEGDFLIDWAATKKKKKAP
jgi:tetratricopeptide (TPR) repeat protein